MTITKPVFLLRPLALAEWPAVLGVYRQCEDFLALGPVAQASEQMVRQDMEHSVRLGGQFCGIFNPNKVMMGIVDFLVSGFEGHPEYASLELLMIAQPYRNQGLGAAVVATVEAEIRRQPSVSVIFSGVQVNNPGAIRFWQRQGYRLNSDARDMGDGTTAYQLRKDLA